MMIKEKLLSASLLIVFAFPLQAWWFPDTDVQWVTLEVIPDTNQQMAFTVGTSQGTLLYAGEKPVAAIDDTSGNAVLSFKSKLDFYGLGSGFHDISHWEKQALPLFPVQWQSRKKKKKSAAAPQPESSRITRIIILNVPHQNSNLCIEVDAFGSPLEIYSPGSISPITILVSEEGDSVLITMIEPIIADNSGAAIPPGVAKRTSTASVLHTDSKRGIRYFTMPDSLEEKPSEELASLNEAFEKFFIDERKPRDKNDRSDFGDDGGASILCPQQ